jgi:hypothetical protein
MKDKKQSTIFPREGGWNGQSLVEMAIIMPLLIVMFIGVIEVGYVLRTQMIMNTTVREGARFATKPNHMDLRDETTAEASYSDVIEQMDVSQGDLLVNEFDGIIITNIYVEAGFPCDFENRLTCDCAIASTNPYTTPITISPVISGYEYYQHDYGFGESRLVISDKVTEMVKYNHDMNCNFGKMNPSGIPSSIHHMVVVEVFYTHNLLLGFPGMGVIDPIPMYSKAVFRKSTDRS